jgi:hypothetical protein
MGALSLPISKNEGSYERNKVLSLWKERESRNQTGISISSSDLSRLPEKTDKNERWKDRIGWKAEASEEWKDTKAKK